MTKCIFCRIAAGEIPAEVVLQDDAFVAFRDIAPKAPVHLVVHICCVRLHPAPHI